MVAESIPEAVLSGKLAEPAFSDLGLGGGFWPSGWVQSLMEWLHVSVGLPWLGCIGVGMCSFKMNIYFTHEVIYILFPGVLTIRLLVFPLVVKSQQNAARMAKIMPEMTVLKQKMSEAQHSGNALEGDGTVSFFRIVV